MIQELRDSGYKLERIYAHTLQLQIVELHDGLPESSELQFAWNWKPVDEHSFSVSLGLQAVPGKDRPEHAALWMVGDFKIAGPDVAPAMIPFLMLGAPSILAPYAREALSALTSRGRFGQITLDVINVPMIMAQMKFHVSDGAILLRERPELAAAYGISPETLADPGSKT